MPLTHWSSGGERITVLMPLIRLFLLLIIIILIKIMPKCTAALLAGIVSDALNLFKIHMFDISLSLTPTNIVTNNKRWDFVSRL